jgi:hypothetical protein
MKENIMAFSVAKLIAGSSAALALAGFVAVTPVEAAPWRGGGAVAAGVIGGLALGAVAAGAYDGYGPYGYGPEPYYGGPRVYDGGYGYGYGYDYDGGYRRAWNNRSNRYRLEHQ